MRSAAAGGSRSRATSAGPRRRRSSGSPRWTSACRSASPPPTRFVRLVGPARAKEIIMECRRYSAADAHAMGLLHRVVPGSSLFKEVRAYAELLAAKPFAPLAERSEEHTSELQSLTNLVCRLLLEKKKNTKRTKSI